MEKHTSDATHKSIENKSFASTLKPQNMLLVKNVSSPSEYRVINDRDSMSERLHILNDQATSPNQNESKKMSLLWSLCLTD